MPLSSSPIGSQGGPKGSSGNASSSGEVRADSNPLFVAQVSDHCDMGEIKELPTLSLLTVVSVLAVDRTEVLGASALLRLTCCRYCARSEV